MASLKAWMAGGVTGLALACVAVPASAAPIVGSFGFTGAATPFVGQPSLGGTQSDLASADWLQFDSVGTFLGSQIPYTLSVNASSGDYVGIMNSLAATLTVGGVPQGQIGTYGHFSGTSVPSEFLIPSVGVVSVPGLIQINTDTEFEMVGGIWSDSGVAGLDLSVTSFTSVTRTTQGGSTFLNISGLGLVSADGFDDTIATFALTANEASGALSWTWASTVASPVPEPATLALLGAGLFGLGLVRRRKAA